MNQKTNARFAADLQQDQRAEALVQQIGKAMLEHYNMELSKKVTHTKKQKALTCCFNGGSVPYGYQIDTDLLYQINPDQAPVVLEIFQRFAANVPMAELLRDLETKDVRNAKGNCYTRKTLTKLLSNRIYIGEYRYTDIVIPGGVPAIMDKELFDAVAARLANSNCR